MFDFLFLLEPCSGIVIHQQQYYFDVSRGRLRPASVGSEFGRQCSSEEYLSWNGRLFPNSGTIIIFPGVFSASQLMLLVRAFFQDDYLDCFGDPDVIGKVIPIFQDIVIWKVICALYPTSIYGRLEPTLKTLSAPGYLFKRFSVLMRSKRISYS